MQCSLKYLRNKSKENKEEFPMNKMISHTSKANVTQQSWAAPKVQQSLGRNSTLYLH